MKVIVEFFGDLPQRLGKRRESFECACNTATELREELLRRFPELAKVDEEYKESGVGLVILVNGRDLRHVDRVDGETIEVSVFPPAAGG